MYNSLIFSTAFVQRPRGGGCARMQFLASRNDHCNLRDRDTSLHSSVDANVFRKFCVSKNERKVDQAAG